MSREGQLVLWRRRGGSGRWVAVDGPGPAATIIDTQVKLNVDSDNRGLGYAYITLPEGVDPNA